MRVASDEFFLEDGIDGTTVWDIKSTLADALGGVYAVERQDAGILLTGERGIQVLAQTCSYDWTSGESHLVMTRVAGVSCAVLPEVVGDLSIFHIWCAASYGLYLWGDLLEIVRDLEGIPVGIESVQDLIGGAAQKIK